MHKIRFSTFAKAYFFYLLMNFAGKLFQIEPHTCFELEREGLVAINGL